MSDVIPPTPMPRFDGSLIYEAVDGVQLGKFGKLGGLLLVGYTRQEAERILEQTEHPSA